MGGAFAIFPGRRLNGCQKLVQTLLQNSPILAAGVRWQVPIACRCAGRWWPSGCQAGRWHAVRCAGRWWPAVRRCCALCRCAPTRRNVVARYTLPAVPVPLAGAGASKFAGQRAATRQMHCAATGLPKCLAAQRVWRCFPRVVPGGRGSKTWALLKARSGGSLVRYPRDTAGTRM